MGIAACIAIFAALCAASGQAGEAVQLFGAIDAMLQSAHIKLETADQREFESNVAAMRKRLDQSTFNTAWSDGHTMRLEQAIAFTQQRIAVPPDSTKTKAAPSTTEDAGLTAREREVLRLLAQGLSNDQIAERLVISAYTVRAHLRAIYGKLGATTRSAATRYALEHHLV